MDKHNCQPPDYPEGWNHGWFCPVCDAHWIYDLSYAGPGYTNPVYSWERDD